VFQDTFFFLWVPNDIVAVFTVMQMN